MILCNKKCIPCCDYCIYVIHDGEIIEAGPHSELLEKKGFYFRLYESQFDVQLESLQGAFCKLFNK